MLSILAGCRSVPPEAAHAYEAEAAENSFSGSAKAYPCHPCSGGKLVGYIGGPGDGVLRFNGITAAKDQDYLVTIYYANGSTSNLTASFGTPGTSAPVVFPPSGGWQSLASVTTRVHLLPGKNSLEVSNHLRHFIADIDRIVVAPAPELESTNEYEAESSVNTFKGSAKAEACKPCSGGKNVGNIGGPGAGILQFNNIQVKHSRTYNLVIQFANGSPEPLSATMCANSESTTVKFPPTGGWTNLASVSVPIRLNAGKNTINFSNNSGYVADLDKITVQDNVTASQR
jgi:hypothetical protein